MIDKILFIGSPATGRKIMQSASINLTPVILELGGKDPFIVFDDANYSDTLELIIRGSFFNLGQNCFSAERIFIQDTVFDKYREGMIQKLKNYRQGPFSGDLNYLDTDCGSMTVASQLENVEVLLKDAVEKGAKILIGGKRNSALCKTPDCLFYEPTIITGVTEKMRIFHEEVFGPVLILFKFSTEADAIKIANATQYGLGATIHTANYARSERVAKAIEAGFIVFNDFGLPYLLQDMPFGGCKISGFGRFNGPEGLRDFSRSKAITIDRIGIRTPVPSFARYPTPSNAPAFAKSLITMFYASGLSVKFYALLSVLKHLLFPPTSTKSKKQQ